MLYFDTALLYIRDGIEIVGVAIIATSTVNTLYEILKALFRGQAPNLNYLRLQLGKSIILALEFMVGADLIGSVVEPDYYTLGLLAILVFVRTFLSYFLDKELAALTPEQRHKLK